MGNIANQIRLATTISPHFGLRSLLQRGGNLASLVGIE
jgi:hypothetical protein